ncbi:GTP diphosphokinase [Photobacterium proteolyticum]|uniref:GTP pyrophosphokinase n=1 Tax=Photobacterium proteolyticum TaxID=1903952 RepID=A0A1Q9GTT5_9GAMM|nr:GTP diphosphokinase [Photobacterium proteolyticum]OLQ78503.1 GTP diphosphokinase [Photobacterium proteolyticum]
MVAVRGAHLKENDTFELSSWVESLQQDAKVAKRITQTYQRCIELTSEEESASLLLWRGREMVEILVTLSMDKDTLVAALLFPLVEAGVYDPEQLKEDYNNTILQMVTGVGQMAAIGQLNATTEGAAQSAQVDNIRRMLLSMVDDFRCVVIKLAERICNLREVKDEPDEVRRAAAKECANIYSPLANRLGIGQLKWEIEDYAFRYNHPNTYKQIAKQLSERRIDREQYIDHFVSDLDESMKASHIKAEVHGRPKHIYSIWRKMQKKSLAFDELFDVRAVRIIADQLQDCYAALGVVHTKYRHLPKEFDDYVANPKPNGYQSIHTVVLGPEGKTIEIQIRTKQMHEESELGVAAHWKYKEGSSGGAKSAYDEKINWLRKLLAWQEEMSDSGEMLDELRSQVFDDRVYAFTPKGDVVDLPLDATPLDFAYHIHSEVGHRCIGAKVEGRIVPFTYRLQMGDQVEIITQKEPNPSRDWLNPNLGFVTSSRARAKVHAWFRKQDRDKNIAAGREILEAELVKIGATLKDAEAYALKRFNVNSAVELYAGVGSGDLRINQVINHINALVNKPTAEEEDQQLLEKLAEASTKVETSKKPQRDAVVVEGVDNLMTHLARCCQPIPGDDIQGFVTQGRGISVHRSDCEQLEELRHVAAERIIDTVWGGGFVGNYNITVRVTASERNGLIKELTNTFANEKVKVSGMKSRIDFKKQMSIMDFDLELTDLEVLSRVLKRIEQVKDVAEAKRLY